VQDAANTPGRLLLIANTSGRVQAGVRPLAEQGFPNIRVTTWGGIVGPGGLPAPVAERLGSAYRSAVTDAAFIEKMAKILEQEYLPPADFGQMIRDTIALYQKLIRENNLRP
jgi:tripartite-type tricarboxylate transporter receptor subunit TctC